MTFYILLASISMAVLMFLLISKTEISLLPNPPPKAMGPLQIVWFIFGALVKQVGGSLSQSNPPQPGFSFAAQK